MVLRRVLPIVLVLSVASWVPSAVSAEPAMVVLEEVVTDPQHDWDGSGTITSSDEYVVLRNLGATVVDLTGWRLVMDDSTPAEEILEGELGPGASHVVLNPTGIMNNDVRLVLVRPDQTVAAEVELGVGGIADGNAAGPLDEAVYLHGAWEGARAPAAFGTGLAPVWVEGMAATGEPVAALQTPWIPGQDASLDVLLHVAPHWNGTTTLRIDGWPVALSHVDGTLWQTAAFTAAPPTAHLTFSADGAVIDTDAGGAPLVARVDATPPTIADGTTGVVNATGHLRWVPSVIDAESGLFETAVATTNRTGATAPLPACADPRQDVPVCPLGRNVTGLRIDAWDRVGNNATFLLPIVNDTRPPTLPDRFTFETGVPPTFGWPASDEPLAHLAVETADDAGGTWNRTRTSLPGDALVFTDQAWRPGTPRAYRLMATDRGGHTNSTGWVTLPPAAVPVQAQAAALDAALAELTAGAAGNVTVRFDRPLATFPRLVLESQRPEPYRLAAEPVPAPDGRSAHYVFVPDGAFPRTGNGSWRFEGGQGADAAPVRDRLAAAAWDVEPPRVVFSGLSDDWLAEERHVVVVSAFDRSGASSTLRVEVGGGVVRQIGPSTVEVAFAREGVHAIRAVAADAGGRTADVSKTLRLDATPPVLRLVAMPERWSEAAPIVLRVEDRLSGVVEASFTAAIRTPAGPQTATLEWNGSHVELRPTETTVKGPFALQVDVRDAAGNRARGALGDPVVPAPVAMHVVVNESAPQTAGAVNVTAVPEGAQGQTAPMAGIPTTAWTDLALPDPAPSQQGSAQQDDGSRMTLVASLVSAGVLGLGTVVYRKKRHPAKGGQKEGDGGMG